MDAIKRDTITRVIRAVEQMTGKEFYIHKKVFEIFEPCSYKDIYSIVANLYKSKREDSYTGYFVEFPLYDEPFIALTYYEVIPSDLATHKETGDKTDIYGVFSEILPIFPSDYNETSFIQNNQLGTFYFSPFRKLD